MLANFYRRLNILSIDVALGAMSGALFFAKLLQVQVLLYGVVCLGLTVWIIYTVDHLLDASRIGKEASTARHRFHQQHFNSLVKGVLIAILINIVLTFFMREQVLLGGAFLSVGVVLYLLINRYLKILKELLISVLYTCGILMPSIAVTNFSWIEIPWIVVFQFILVAFLNLLVFSWYDWENDIRDGTTSFATKLGMKTTRTCILVLFACVVAGLFFSTLPSASLLLVVMALLQVLIFFNKKHLLHNDRFRIAGEAVFILPLFYLLF